MLSMQLFHARLFQRPEIRELFWSALAQLTKVSREDVAALESGMDWTPWGSGSA